MYIAPSPPYPTQHIGDWLAQSSPTHLSGWVGMLALSSVLPNTVWYSSLYARGSPRFSAGAKWAVALHLLNKNTYLKKLLLLSKWVCQCIIYKNLFHIAGSCLCLWSWWHFSQCRKEMVEKFKKVESGEGKLRLGKSHEVPTDYNSMDYLEINFLFNFFRLTFLPYHLILYTKSLKLQTVQLVIP